MPKKHSGSKKSKSEKQSKLQQWVAKYRQTTWKQTMIVIPPFEGANRQKRRSEQSDLNHLWGSEKQDANTRRHKANMKARNRRQRKATRALHQNQRRAK